MDILLLIKSIFYYVGNIGFVFLFLLTMFQLLVYLPAWFIFKKVVGEAKLRFILRNLQYLVLAAGAGYIMLTPVQLISGYFKVSILLYIIFCIYALYYKIKRISNWATLNFEYRDEPEQLVLQKKDKYFIILAALLFVFISFGSLYDLPFGFYYPAVMLSDIFYFAGMISSTIASVLGWIFLYGLFENLSDRALHLFSGKTSAGI